jgi:hypothetical protein
MKYLTMLVVSTTTLGACGGIDSDLEPGAGNDPGTGTSTLAIEGDIRAEPRFVNARASGDFDTELSVEVTLNLQVVTTGNVTVTSSSGSVPLVFRADTNRWEAIAAGYDEVYVVDVDSGDDFVHGVRVDGPDIHVFGEPTLGATVDSTVPLKVTWASEEAASSASIKAEEIDRVAIPDTGLYMLSGGALKADKDTARENTLELVRMNRVTPAGAVGGSEVSVTVENRIEVIAMPNPAL